MEILKVSSKSSPNKVAGAIVGSLKKNEKVEIQAIGAGAVNQASKSLAVARRFLEQEGLDLYVSQLSLKFKSVMKQEPVYLSRFTFKKVSLKTNFVELKNLMEDGGAFGRTESYCKSLHYRRKDL